jgi:galactan endo-1,6-beta-galactosidase
MQIIDGGCDYTIAAYDSSTQKLVIVAVNWDKGQYITFDPNSERML